MLRFFQALRDVFAGPDSHAQYRYGDSVQEDKDATYKPRLEDEVKARIRAQLAEDAEPVADVVRGIWK